MSRLTRGVMVAVVLALVGLAVAYGAGLFEGTPCDITGTITRDGQPLVWPTDEGRTLLVLFFPEPRRGRDPSPAEADGAAGTYKVTGIKSGRYRVAIHMFYNGHQDVLHNKFDPGNTPLVVDVTEDGQVLNIDLPKDLPQ